MKNQASFAWKANSEGLNKKNNTFQLNYNSCIADGKEYCFRTILIVNQLSEKAISFPSTMVLFIKNDIKSTKRGGNNIPVDIDYIEFNFIKKPFPSTIVLLSFNENTISINNSSFET